MEEGTESKDEKIVFFTSKSQLAKIEDFRFSCRLSSRAEAVRKLIEIAIVSLDEKKKTSHSVTGDYLKAAEEQEPYISDRKPVRRGKKK
ncbi:MAG: hypothetical protein HQL05_01080 [Nitrospirae bacterium]|uniref:hypothetical protein n=1 Tax=Candidatus Magnetobacterium casense TaxID=1455061 RepID=UPI00058C41C3|nr:hypothetical protein [Candidatus Magnetobacterium casensis]MBF0336401.1 hypothetical protein [Nitrospirota bacterium]